MSGLNLDDLRKVNVARCEEVYHPVDDWSPTDWACALAGEVGETCNCIKKLKRLKDEKEYPKREKIDFLRNEIAKELADVIIYVDLLAARLDINLSDAVRGKFNQVSRIKGSTHSL